MEFFFFWELVSW